MKELFFAQYLGQKINTSLNGTVLDGNWIQRIQREETDFCLLLRSMDQLTDEELIRIGLISKFPNLGGRLKVGKDIIQKIKSGFFPTYEKDLYQYLNRIGVLQSFTYLDEKQNPITLQPSEIIEKGWAKYEN